jgi:RNA polymerase sigma-70 factor (ECF subfamily)
LDDFAELVERHQTMVFRTLERLTGEREGLEDLAQEVFLRLFRALPQFRGQARIRDSRCHLPAFLHVASG